MCVSVPVCAFENYLHFLHANKFARYINEIIQKLFWRPLSPFCFVCCQLFVLMLLLVFVLLLLSK